MTSWPATMGYAKKGFPKVVQDYKGFHQVAFHVKSRIRLIIAWHQQYKICVHVNRNITQKVGTHNKIYKFTQLLSCLITIKNPNFLKFTVLGWWYPSKFFTLILISSDNFLIVPNNNFTSSFEVMDHLTLGPKAEDWNRLNDKAWCSLLSEENHFLIAPATADWLAMDGHIELISMTCPRSTEMSPSKAVTMAIWRGRPALVVVSCHRKADNVLLRFSTFLSSHPQAATPSLKIIKQLVNYGTTLTCERMYWYWKTLWL